MTADFMCWKNFSNTCPYNDIKFSKLEYVLTIIIMYFFSFHNIFLYTEQASSFHVLVDFLIVHDHMSLFSFFFFRKTLISFTSFFAVFLYYFDKI